MAADSSMGFHQGITASMYNQPNSNVGIGGGAGGMATAPRTVSEASSNAGLYLSPNTSVISNSSGVDPSRSSSWDVGHASGASKYKFVTGSPAAWSDQELSILREGLVRYAPEPNIVKYIKIAAMLPNKTIRDVAIQHNTKRQVAKMTAGGFQIGVIGSLMLSVASSVAIVICNKAFISTLGFPFAATLTSWHLMVTFCTLHVAQRMHFFEPKAIDGQTVVLFGLLNGTSIGLLNISLGFNSLGFYQMTELAIIPFTVLLEIIFLKKRFSVTIKFSLLVLLLGVGIASVTDLKLNLLGSIFSAIAIATTSVSQILTNTIQRKLKVSSTQLLYQSAPYQAAIMSAIGPSMDQLLTNRSVFAHKYTLPVMSFIILSCLIVVAVNFSTFLAIGTTSPVTYKVLGHLKTCLVLSFGYTLLHDPFMMRNVLGILVAIFGMALYSYFSVREGERKRGVGDASGLPVSSQVQTMDKQGKEAEPLLLVTMDTSDKKKANGVAQD